MEEEERVSLTENIFFLFQPHGSVFNHNLEIQMGKVLWYSI
jgi:hypothetical protein